MREWLNEVGAFFGGQPILLLFAVIALGFLLGEVRFPGGFRFGVAAVLFVGLGVGFIWPTIAFPAAFAPLGLALFVYCLGLQAGPGFLRSFRRDGLRLTLCCLFALFVIVAGCGVLYFYLGASPALVAGMFAGISTNTAALGAAGDAAAILGADAAAANPIVLGYALHYPVGIIFSLLFIHFLAPKRGEGEVSPSVEPPTPPAAPQTFDVMKTRTPAEPWTGATLAAATGLVLSRFRSSEGLIDFIHPETVLPPGCSLVAIGTPPQLARLESLVGPVSGDSLQMHWEGFEKRRFFVSRKDLVGIPLRELRLDARGIVISRLRRGDVEISVDGSTRLQLGDRVRAVFRSGEEGAVARLFGDSITVSSETGYLSFVVGIIAGLLLGVIPVPVPFLESPLRLGVAGGALVAGLVLGARGRTGPLVWHLPITVNLTLRQTGLLFFLAGAGLQAGAGLESALPEADAVLFAAGVGILVISQVVFVGLAFWLLPRQTGALLGGLAALQTQPGALVFAVSRAPANEVNSAYAAVYPLCLILKIIIAQLLILPLAT
ncbi:MAG: hypothetical protein JJT96_09300 [Opitutales bacterium]|nr:hypothetical protein [Opitutales bacterium]